ncbi:MAG: UDP-N-acetylglucosamine 1-carboxyvinyltransferase [Clostridiales bacterium]|nr:UDP-N-acetylglucosamine 1-carboxyvinyltransferase [Clostridiales bacterium]
MIKYVIRGGRPLSGEVSVSGAKNAALGVIAASSLVEGVTRIENIPKILDVTLMLEILRELGAKVRLVNGSTVEIDSTSIVNTSASYEAMRKIRGSYYFIGALLGRFGHAVVAMPGGCDLGVRPIDQHIKGFEALGAEVKVKSGFIHATAREGRLKGAHVYFDVITVGATINVMIAATMADGLTVIENAAKEPHVVDTANFLNSMGANITGAGTDVIKIRGVESLHGGTYSIIPDQIEAGTYIAAVAAAGGSVLVKNVIPKHLECITAKFSEIGMSFEEYDDALLVSRTGKLMKTNVKTLPYPGFPTDMQPQITAALCLAEGTSVVTEGIYDNRFKYVDELKRMGANIQVDGKVAVVEGIESFSGAPLCACDLRAGAALVIAGLAAKGTTEIRGVHHIERGYEKMVEKVRGLGGDIVCVDVPDADELSEVG